MKNDFYHIAGFFVSDQLAYQHQMSGTADRKELCESLNNSQNYDVNKFVHKLMYVEGMQSEKQEPRRTGESKVYIMNRMVRMGWV